MHAARMREQLDHVSEQDVAGSWSFFAPTIGYDQAASVLKDFSDLDVCTPCS